MEVGRVEGGQQQEEQSAGLEKCSMQQDCSTCLVCRIFTGCVCVSSFRVSRAGSRRQRAGAWEIWKEKISKVYFSRMTDYSPDNAFFWLCRKGELWEPPPSAFSSQSFNRLIKFLGTEWNNIFLFWYQEPAGILKIDPEDEGLFFLTWKIPGANVVL